MEKTEHKLKLLFSELKAQDSQRVPSFDSVVLAALPPASTRWPLMCRPQFALAGVAIVSLIAGITVASFRAHTRSLEREMHRWAALSEWKAPTDALLGVSGTPWDTPTAWPSDSPTNDNVSPDTTTKKL